MKFSLFEKSAKHIIFAVTYKIHLIFNFDQIWFTSTLKAEICNGIPE